MRAVNWMLIYMMASFMTGAYGSDGNDPFGYAGALFFVGAIGLSSYKMAVALKREGWTSASRPASSRVMIAVRAHRAQPSSRLIGGISSDIGRQSERRFISSIIGVDDGYLYWDYYVVIVREKKEPAGRDKK